MKRLKFVSNDNHQKEFAAAVRKNVNDYFRKKGISTKGNLPMVIQTVVMLSVYIIPFVLLFTVPMSAWFSMLMWILMGVGMAGIGMCVMHDAVHGSYSHKEWVNRLMAISKLTGDFTQLLLYNKEGITRQYHINPVFEYTKMVFLKIIYLFVFIALPVWFTPFYWWQVLLGFLLMHWTAGFILSTIFQMAHLVEGAEELLPNSEGIIEREWACLLYTSDA